MVVVVVMVIVVVMVVVMCVQKAAVALDRVAQGSIETM